MESAKHFSLRAGLCSIAAVVVLAVVCLLLLTCFYRPTLTQGHSMEPTLAEGDKGFAWVYHYAPTRGDVVVIKDVHEDNKYIVKRVIGLAGDLIDIDFWTGAVTRNGELLEEPYVTEPSVTPGDLWYPVTVPQGHVFVMGDNRNHSTDSRTTYTGMIAEENIEGKMVFRFFPFDKLGKIE